MNRNRYIPLLFSLCLLTGCAGQDAQEAEQAARLLTEPSITETTPETEPSTAPETTVPETEPPTTEHPVLHEPPEGALLTVPDRVEVHTELTLGELLAGTNVQLENADTLLETNSIGEFTVPVSYTYEGTKYEHEISYKVADIEPPLLLNGGWGAEVKLGESFDLNEHVGFADNYDAAPVLTYTGMVDTNVCGRYPLTAVVTDSSGNTLRWDLAIEVVEQKSTPPDNTPRLTFDTLMQQYAGEHVRFGIDVSKWQGEIDFEAVKNAGCSFVLMRMGYFYDEIAMDQYYLSNMEKARAAGLDVGVYIYTTANTEEEVRENAAWIAQQLNGQSLDFPVVFDWESFSNFQKYGMSIHDLNSLFTLFAEEMERYGYSAMLYGSKNYLENIWYDHSESPVWLANYTEQTDYAGDYVMWQMSSHGRIHGIAGDVDLNILYTDRLAEKTGGNPLPEQRTPLR